MDDLKEHIKCITAETNSLRDRVHEAESVIAQLKSTGEQSIDQLMETLYMMKMRQQELDSESGALREDINDREHILKEKEGVKAGILQQIQIDKATRENEIYRLREQLDDQRNYLDDQRRLLNELSALAEQYQNGIADATTDLQKKTRFTNQLNMEYQEVDQSMAGLQQIKENELNA